MKIKTSPKCIFCEKEDETILHLFFECRYVHELLLSLADWINSSTDLKIVLDKTEFILGYTDRNEQALYTVMLLAKKYIYDTKMQEGRLNFEQLKIRIIGHVNVIKYIHTIKDKLPTFEKEWDDMKFLFDITDL